MRRVAINNTKNNNDDDDNHKNNNKNNNNNNNRDLLIGLQSTRLSTSAIFEFQTSDVSRALALRVCFR